LFGGDSAAIGEGALASGFPSSRIARHDSIGTLRDAVARFDGSVLFKGSRGYALERALPADLGGASAH